MLEWGLSAAGLVTLSLTAYLLFLRARHKSTRTRVNFTSYKAQELQKRGHYFNIVE
jgi:hypothetical protein